MNSTRIGYDGNSSTEIHLKKSLEITSEIASQITGLPSTEDWYVLKYNSSTDSWTLVSKHSGFRAADDKFKSECGAVGIEAEGLEVGRDREVKPNKNGREVNK